jgi:hypothetical protein
MTSCSTATIKIVAHHDGAQKTRAMTALSTEWLRAKIFSRRNIIGAHERYGTQQPAASPSAQLISDRKTDNPCNSGGIAVGG